MAKVSLGYFVGAPLLVIALLPSAGCRQRSSHDYTRSAANARAILLSGPTDLRTDAAVTTSDGNTKEEPESLTPDDLSTFPIPAQFRHAHATVEAFCRRFLPWARAHAKAETAVDFQWNDAPPVQSPQCKEVTLPPLENISEPWSGVKGVHLAWAYHDAIWVFGVSNAGVIPTTLHFDDKYGNGMGCLAVWSRDKLDAIRAENGWLAATIDGYGPTNTKDGPVAEQMYQRGLALCRTDHNDLRCFELNPQYQRSLASKALPFTDAGWTNPDLVPWDRVDDFHIDESGAMTRVRVR